MTAQTTAGPLRAQLAPEDLSVSQNWLYFVNGRDTWEIALSGEQQRNSFYDEILGTVRCGPEDFIDQQVKVVIARGAEAISISTN